MNNPAKVDNVMESLEELMQDIRLLAVRYRQTTGAALPLTAELSRFDAAKHLNLKLIEDGNAGHDAVGLAKPLLQHRVLIKGRVIFESSKSSPRLGQLNTGGDWQDVILVLYEENYEAADIYFASREDINQALNMNSGNQRKKRGAMSIAQFKIIGRLIWAKDTGLVSATIANS